MNALGVVMWIAAAPMIAIFAVFINEVAFGLFPLHRKAPANGEPFRIAILIPAHNEANGIGQTLARVRNVLPLQAKILVVADNCSDDTAERARTSGTEVIERSDPVRRGKGYALDFGRTHLSNSPPDCVMVLDADCIPEPGTIETLGAAALETARPVQSVNLMRAGSDASPIVQISNFAFLIKNLIRQRGLVRSGGPAMLTGTGMAFPWPVFEKLPLASSNIVEDLAITVLVPPLALLFALGFALAILLGGVAALGATAKPALTILAMMGASLILLAVAWWREGRALLSFGAIFRIPLYVLWKIPVYLKLVRGAETEWVRTKRPD